MSANRLITALSAPDRARIERHFQRVTLARGAVLFEPGDNVVDVHFPEQGMIAALVLDMREGAAAEAAMIGYEGAIGGIVSAGEKPAYTRGVIQMAGVALKLSIEELEDAKAGSHTLRDHFERYSDCLLAQVMQSAACNAVHDVEARLARWLLATHDRVGVSDLPVTHDFIAEMLGVQRTYVTRIVGQLAEHGAIKGGRGAITIVDRAHLEQQSCECYAALRRHFDRLLPGVLPKATA